MIKSVFERLNADCECVCSKKTVNEAREAIKKATQDKVINIEQTAYLLETVQEAIDQLPYTIEEQTK